MKIKKYFAPLCSIFLFFVLSFYSHHVFAIPSGVYVGGMVGSAKIHANADSDQISPATKNQDSLGWRVDVGYKYNLNIAIEAGFIDWADLSFKNTMGFPGAEVKLDQKSVDLMGKFLYPLNAAASIYAEGGVTYVKIQADANTAAKAAGVDISKKEVFKPIFGLGANYEFYPGVLGDITWLTIPSGSGVHSSNFWGIGLTFFVG